MSEEAAFLRAIQANPTDATAKLVYADWLDENGEREKAEYLRLLVRLQATQDPNSERYRLWDLGKRHRVWVNLVHGANMRWDDVTLYALGRLEGVLHGFAALNGHRSDIGYDFHPVLLPQAATLEETAEGQYPADCAPINLEPLGNWESGLTTILEEWLFHELRHLATPQSRLAMFDAHGRQWIIADVLAHVRAVINPTAGWRVRVTPKGFYALDWADVALEAADRVLFLHFSFSD